MGEESVLSIPDNEITSICQGETNIGDYSKLRIFKTLFSENGIPVDLKGQFWKKLAGVVEGPKDEWAFTAMASKPNPQLCE